MELFHVQNARTASVAPGRENAPRKTCTSVAGSASRGRSSAPPSLPGNGAKRGSLPSGFFSARSNGGGNRQTTSLPLSATAQMDAASTSLSRSTPGGASGMGGASSSGGDDAL